MDSRPNKRKLETPRAHSIDVNLLKLDDLPFPNFNKPYQLAVFSTVESTGCNDDSVPSDIKSLQHTVPSIRKSLPRILSDTPTLNKRVISEPDDLTDVRFDLNAGYGTQIKKKDEQQYLNLLLDCLIRENLVGKSDFVCWRGLLTKIAATPYDCNGKYDDGLKIAVQRIGNTWYMCEFPTNEALQTMENQTDKQKLMAYWGMKFESYVTAKPGQTPELDTPLNFNDEFTSVVQTKLGSLSLLYAGEVDCCFPQDQDRYVELKTTRKPEHRGQERSFRLFKLLKWWLQSFLIGIDDILCGFRDDNGVVHSCKWFQVSRIPRLANKDTRYWKPARCFNFLKQFLEGVKRTVTETDVPYVFHRQPCSSTFHLHIDHDDQHVFLPSWFVKINRESS